MGAGALCLLQETVRPSLVLTLRSLRYLFSIYDLYKGLRAIRCPASTTKYGVTGVQMDASIFLRAIVLMLDEIDTRIVDDSLAPQPYEVTAPELRDLVRLAGMSRPRTVVGRLALARAVAESIV
jgi:hypothetical protein